jgi:hypothetical protein
MESYQEKAKELFEDMGEAEDSKIDNNISIILRCILIILFL